MFKEQQEKGIAMLSKRAQGPKGTFYWLEEVILVIIIDKIPCMTNAFQWFNTVEVYFCCIVCSGLHEEHQLNLLRGWVAFCLIIHGPKVLPS
jgi:hypothetical protein